MRWWRGARVHWRPTPSTELLEHLARAARAARLVHTHRYLKGGQFNSGGMQHYILGGRS